MATRIRLSVPLLGSFVLVAIILRNIAGCQCRELSSLATHSNFLKAYYKAKSRKTSSWSCVHDPGVCARIYGHGNSQDNWACCSKKYCINVSSDQFHCGTCGNACGYGLSCCGGMCVDVNNDRSHCGSCSSVCQEPCNFGMCGYGHGYGNSQHKEVEH